MRGSVSTSNSTNSLADQKVVVLQAAVRSGQRGPDLQVSVHRQHHGDPDGNGVCGDTSMCVHEAKVGPGSGVLGRRVFGSVEAVVVQCEGHVKEHGQQVTKG